MLPHDCEGLNDIECWHVELFAERLERCRLQNLGEANAFRVARAAARHRFPLEPGEAARVDEYIASRFGVPEPVPRGTAGLPAPTMIVN
jgi:hypothetical protein